MSSSDRERALGQRGAVLLLTGLPGAGKTELAYAVERALFERGRFGLVIDPEDAVSLGNAAVRHDPSEAPGAVLELVQRASGAGWLTLLAFATPEREQRERVRERAGAQRYVEIFVSTPVAACRERGAKAFYARGEEPRYEVPAAADLSVDLQREPLEQAVRRVVGLLEERRLLQPE